MEKIREALLHKIFNYLKENNFFIGEEWKIDAELFHLIEDYLISLHLSEYVFLETVDIRLADLKEKIRLKNECIFFDQAGVYLFELRKDIDKFLEIQKNTKKYLEEEFHEINYMYNSIKIFQEKIRADDFEDLAYHFLHHSKSDYKRIHGYMKAAEINYLDTTKEGKMFYPIITDIFIDYWRIRSNYIVHQDIIKKHTNDYIVLKKRIEDQKIDFHLDSFLRIKHFKLNRKNHIHNFLLTQYQEKIDNHSSINKIFRKLLLAKRDDDFCSPKTIDKYKLRYNKTDRIFKSFSYSKFFL